MKLLDRIIQYITGIIFIISGAVKLNDPAGTAIKLHEYFDVFSSDISPIFEHFIPFSLFFSILLSSLEILLGLALLIGWRKRLTQGLLAAMIIFFGFLTFYSAYYNKVTDCGCFGDAIKFTPWESFTKDVLLGVFVFYLIARNGVKGYFTDAGRNLMMALCMATCAVVAYMAIEHLPFVDFRPFKVGVNIPEAMQPSAPFIYSYTMEKDGQQVTLKEYPTDTTYKFVSMKLENPEAQPTILDFSIWNDDGDFTGYALQGAKLFIISNNITLADLAAFEKIKHLTDAVSEQVEPMLLTSSTTEQVAPVREQYQLNSPIYFGDDTVLKTIIRANPGIVLVKDGTILGKWHYNDCPDPQTILSLIKE